MERRCEHCNGEMPNRVGQQYCAPCFRQRNLDRLAAKRRAAGIVPVGATIPCVECGAGIVKNSGSTRYCAPCGRARRKATFRAHNARRSPEKKAEYHAKRKLNPSRQDYMRAYTTAYTRKRRRVPANRLNHRMGQLLRSSLGSKKGGRGWPCILGYSLDDLVKHLERQFVGGMSWNNMGEWHVDHILPLAGFSFADENDPDFRAAWALTNLRPLWGVDNIRKHAKRLHLL